MQYLLTSSAVIRFLVDSAMEYSNISHRRRVKDSWEVICVSVLLCISYWWCERRRRDIAACDHQERWTTRSVSWSAAKLCESSSSSQYQLRGLRTLSRLSECQTMIGNAVPHIVISLSWASLTSCDDWCQCLPRLVITCHSPLTCHLIVSQSIFVFQPRQFYCKFFTYCG